LGFPTANLTLPGYLALPADGVYAAKAFLAEKEYKAVANIGSCPTFGQEEHRLEVHLLDFKGDIKGQTLKVEFVEFLRSEVCFANAEALKAQISVDILKARDILR
jgi:riboflavin kinase/FMN adenylyltransferase